MAKPRLVVATRNRHKTAEIRAMIGSCYEVADVNDFPGLPAIEETGSTFLDNATLKAVGISRCLEGIVLSDDSGLEVDALGGAPGVWSSGFGGEEGNHARNNARLLRELASVPAEARRARFRCVMVLARRGEVLAHFEGAVAGRVLDEARGAGGFGYDPLFVPDGHRASFGELPQEVKNLLSHRAPPHPNRATNVPVTVTIRGGTTRTVRINQRSTSEGGFFSLGEFKLPAGKATTVTLSNAGTTGYVVADGVQFLPVIR